MLARQRIVTAVAACAGLLGLLTQIVITAARRAEYQWDLRPYYDAAVGHGSLCNLYPPYRPLLLMPLGLLSPGAAFYTFLLIKIIALGVCLWLSHEMIRGRAGFGLFFLVSCLGFNGALGFDLRAGNVATIEVILLLLAFRGLCVGRIVRFSVLVILAGSMKILPAAFLLLLLLPLPPPRTRTRMHTARGECSLLHRDLLWGSSAYPWFYFRNS